MTVPNNPESNNPTTQAAVTQTTESIDQETMSGLAQSVSEATGKPYVAEGVAAPVTTIPQIKIEGGELANPPSTIQPQSEPTKSNSFFSPFERDLQHTFGGLTRDAGDMAGETGVYTGKAAGVLSIEVERAKRLAQGTGGEVVMTNGTNLKKAA